MMNRTQARDEMLARVKELVDGMGTDIKPTMIWEDNAQTLPSGDTTWARASVRHFEEGQASLANHGGVRRWRAQGIVFVQIFTPAGEGLARADEISSTIVAGFRGWSSPGGAWFRRPRAEEIGVSGAWMQVNVAVDFEYDEIQ